ncbi:MAG: helix-turn-helix domain-containing protein [Bryobacteraceae bacterium]
MSSHQISIPPGGEEQLRTLRNLLQRGEATITGANDERQLIPAPVRDVLVRILTHMQEGQAITIIPASHELSSQEAADLLGVSRQYMVRLLEDGKLPFHRAGTHRRINLQDLMAYKKERDRQRREALDQMAREEVEAGTYDVFVLPEE